MRGEALGARLFPARPRPSPTTARLRPRVKPKLREFASNTYSQYGEDGIIKKIFEEVGTTSRLCVEFGAWDGFYLSNTAALWTNGWKAILIEGDRERFASLVGKVAAYPVVCVNAYVGHEDGDDLATILANHQISQPIDLLSIDIDGDEYYILKNLRSLRPRVIVCEYNPTIPAGLDLFPDPHNQFGASAAALVRLARERGYGLVAMTDTNCFFVQEQDLPALAHFETRLEEIKLDTHLTYLMTSYRGDYIASGKAPYGLAYPYTGVLHGPHEPVRLSTRFLRPFALLLRRLKAFLRTRRYVA
jgi:hypothetical protein